MLRLVAVRSPTRIVVVAIAALSAAAGCGGRSPIEPGDGGSTGGHGGGSSGGHSGSAGTSGAGGTAGSCDTLDEMTCTTRPDCTAQFCSVCPNQQPTFAGCREPGAPPVECPAEACVRPTCGSLGEAACKMRGDCAVLSCPDCMGGQNFAACGVPGDEIGCGPCPPSCAGLEEATCKGTS